MEELNIEGRFRVYWVSILFLLVLFGSASGQLTY